MSTNPDDYADLSPEKRAELRHAAAVARANKAEGAVDAFEKKRESLGDAFGEAFLNWRMVKGTSPRAQMARKQNLAKMAFVGLKAAFHEFTDPREQSPQADAQQTGVHRPGGFSGLFNNIGGWWNRHLEEGRQKAPAIRAGAESAVDQVRNWLNPQSGRSGGDAPPPPSAT